MPLIRGKPTLRQLADDGVPSDEDILAIIALHNETELCRAQIIKDFMNAIPGIIPILVERYYTNDLITVDLIQRKITWGEANKRRADVKTATNAKAQEFFDQLNGDFVVSHEAELAQRQAALNALSQWSYQQQLLMQNQRLIDALNQLPLMHCKLVPDGNGNLTSNCQ